MAYTTTDMVSAYLGETLSATTNPTSTQVEEFIERVEAEIDSITGTSYSTQTATDELYDYDKYSVFVKDPTMAQVGRIDRIYAPILNVFKLYNYPVISVTSLEVNHGTIDSQNWVSLTEDDDFALYSAEGVIAFIKSSALPTENLQSMKITYTYGYASVPPMIERLATLMVVKEVLRAKQTTSSYTNIDDISIESISISKSTSQSVQLLRSIQYEINDLLEKIGTLNYWLV